MRFSRVRRLIAARRRRVPREAVSDAVEVAGIGCLVGAAWWWVPILGLVALGLSLLLVGWVLGADESAPAGRVGP